MRMLNRAAGPGRCSALGTGCSAEHPSPSARGFRRLTWCPSRRAKPRLCYGRSVTQAPGGDQLASQLLLYVRRWTRLWGVRGLDRHLCIEWSPRLRRSLGRAFPDHDLVRLSPALLSAPRSRLLETLCHELAHLAVRRLHGYHRRPHGPEWSRLVRAAGFPPHAQARGMETGPPRLRATRYLHRCEVCHARRVARRPVRRWRCAECVAAGLDGKLEIVKLAAGQ
jgi:SprT protein